MFSSTTSIVSRTRSTVCCRLITPASARGAAPKTSRGDGGGAVGLVLVPVDERLGCRPARSARPRSGPRRDSSPEPRHVRLHAGHRGRGEGARPSAAAAGAIASRSRTRLLPSCTRAYVTGTTRGARPVPIGWDPQGHKGFMRCDSGAVLVESPHALPRRSTMANSLEVQYLTIHGHRRAYVKAGHRSRAAAAARPRLRPHDLGAGDRRAGPRATP